MTMKFGRFLLALILALAVAGCGDDDDDSTHPDAVDDDTDDDNADDDVDDDGDDDTWPPLPDDDAEDVELWLVPPDPAAPMAAWFDAHPWLTDFSLYSSYFDRREGYPGRGALGDFGIGNGRVFALSGMNQRLNALTEHTGPFYQNMGGKFSDTSARLFVAGDEVEVGRQWVFRTRGAAILVSRTEAADGAPALFTVDFVPPGIDAVVRFLIVRNESGAAIDDISVRQHPHRNSSETVEQTDGHVVQRRGPKRVYLGAADDPSYTHAVIDDALTVRWASLAAGEEATALTYFAYVTEDDATAYADIRASLTDVGIDALLDDTRLWWTDYLERGARLDAPDPKVRDWYEGLQVMIGVSTDQSGAVSPMSRYTSAWLRDTWGAVAFYLQIGRVADAKGMFDWLYTFDVWRHGITNSAPLSTDLSGVTEPADARTFWEGCDFMPGRYKAEAPSYLPLMYGRYYDVTGDADLIADRYEYLRATLTLQERSPENLLRFSGDETYRYALMIALFEIEEPQENYYSLNSNLLYVVAAERMAAFAWALGDDADAAIFAGEADDVRAATEDHYRDGDRYAPVLDLVTLAPWNEPFEDVSTKPVYLGYLDPTSPEAEAGVADYVGVLERDDGTLLYPEGFFGYAPSPLYDGMVPGFHLTNVARVDHPGAERVFNALDLTASRSGNYSEMHTRNHNMLTVTHAPSGMGLEEITSRYRPWEGGVNGESMIEYLFGARTDCPNGRITLFPHLPNRWPHAAMTGLPAGPGGRYDIDVTRDGSTWTAVVSNQAADDFTLDVTFADDGDLDGAATVDDVAHGDIVWRRSLGRTRATVQNVALPAGASVTVALTFQDQEAP